VLTDYVVHLCKGVEAENTKPALIGAGGFPELFGAILVYVLSVL